MPHLKAESNMSMKAVPTPLGMQFNHIRHIMANYIPDTFGMSIMVCDNDINKCYVYVHDTQSPNYGLTVYGYGNCSYSACLNWIIEDVRSRRFDKDDNNRCHTYN